MLKFAIGTRPSLATVRPDATGPDRCPARVSEVPGILARAASWPHFGGAADPRTRRTYVVTDLGTSTTAPTFPSRSAPPRVPIG